MSPGPVTAHPKFDPVSGEMLFFGYSANGPGSNAIRYNVCDKDGNLTKNVFLEAPYSAMVHDFFVTQTHVIFPIFPVTTSIERAMTGGRKTWALGDGYMGGEAVFAPRVGASGEGDG